MGFLDKFKKKTDEDDDDLDELDTDATATPDDGDEDDDDAPSGGGLLGRASGFLGKVKKLSSGGDGDGGGGIGSLLGKVKGIRGGNNDSDDSDLDDDDDELDAGQDDEEGEQPIRRSGIAAALDGNSDAAESSEEEADKEEIPVALTAGSASMDFGSLFEEEFVFDPTLKDLAESLDNVSAVELAADLRTFLEELQ